jgi:hypothetical protein
VDPLAERLIVGQKLLDQAPQAAAGSDDLVLGLCGISSSAQPRDSPGQRQGLPGLSGFGEQGGEGSPRHVAMFQAMTALPRKRRIVQTLGSLLRDGPRS